MKLIAWDFDGVLNRGHQGSFFEWQRSFEADLGVSAAVFTEYILIQQQSPWGMPFALSNGSSIPLVSPWIPYSGFCLFFSLVIILITIQMVKRKETT